MSVVLPGYQDEVKNINNEFSGIVVAVYVKDGIKYFDVRVDDRIYYETRASNWTLVSAVNE